MIITDVNDNAPQFESSQYDLWVAENSPVGTIVGTIIARDQDEEENARIQFRIFGGIDAKLFDIETVFLCRFISTGKAAEIESLIIPINRFALKQWRQSFRMFQYETLLNIFTSFSQFYQCV